MPLMPFTAGLTIAESVANETFSELIPFQPDRPGSYLERRYANDASRFVELDDARVHYRDEGPADAPVLLTIHGVYSSLHTWDGWVEQLSDDVRVIRLDMPGFGLTGPGAPGEHRLQTLIDTVGEFCDELGLSDLAVAGNSLGGAVAWRFSIQRPDLADRLLLLDAGGATLLSALAHNYRAFGTDIFPRYVTPRMAIRLALKDAYSDTSKVTRSLINRYHDLLLRSGNRRAVMEIAENYRDENFDASGSTVDGANGPVLPSACDPTPSIVDDFDISDVDVPTLFQWGSDDTWLPIHFGRELAADVSNSTFVEYENVGHVVMEEAPVPTAADAASFVRT